MFQEHNFIKKRPSQNVAGEKRAKKRGSCRLCLFFLSIFLCATMDLYYTSPLPYPLNHPVSIYMCLCLTTPHPQEFFRHEILPLATTKFFFSFEFFVEICETCFSHHIQAATWWNGGSTNCFVFLRLLVYTQTTVGCAKRKHTMLYRKQNFFHRFKDVVGMSESLNHPKPLFKQGHLTVLREKIFHPTH